MVTEGRMSFYSDHSSDSMIHNQKKLNDERLNYAVQTWLDLNQNNERQLNEMNNTKLDCKSNSSNIKSTKLNGCFAENLHPRLTSRLDEDVELATCVEMNQRTKGEIGESQEVVDECVERKTHQEKSDHIDKEKRTGAPFKFEQGDRFSFYDNVPVSEITFEDMSLSTNGEKRTVSNSSFLPSTESKEELQPLTSEQIPNINNIVTAVNLVNQRHTEFLRTYSDTCTSSTSDSISSSKNGRIPYQKSPERRKRKTRSLLAQRTHLQHGVNFADKR